MWTCSDDTRLIPYASLLWWEADLQITEWSSFPSHGIASECKPNQVRTKRRNRCVSGCRDSSPTPTCCTRLSCIRAAARKLPNTATWCVLDTLTYCGKNKRRTLLSHTASGGSFQSRGPRISSKPTRNNLHSPPRSNVWSAWDLSSQVGAGRHLKCEFRGVSPHMHFGGRRRKSY